MGYAIQFTASAREQIKSLSARQRATVIEAIERELTHQPRQETRNRKRLRPNPLAPWELRLGGLRVFYDVTQGRDSRVNILAVGLKQGNRLIVAGKDIQL